MLQLNQFFFGPQHHQIIFFLKEKPKELENQPLLLLRGYLIVIY